MPNKQGEPSTVAEAEARKMKWCSPSPYMVLRYNRDTEKWQGGPRCQAWDGDSQCPLFALDKQKGKCRAHGARPQALKMMEVQRELKAQAQERLNPYLDYPDPEMLKVIESFASDTGRKKLEDEVFAAKVAVAVAMQEMQNDPERKGFREIATTKTCLSMLLDIAKLEEAKVKIETAEQYIFTPSSVKSMMARLKSGMNDCFEQTAQKHQSPEVFQALSDMYQLISQLFARWSIDGQQAVDILWLMPQVKNL